MSHNKNLTQRGPLHFQMHFHHAEFKLDHVSNTVPDST